MCRSLLSLTVLGLMMSSPPLPAADNTNPASQISRRQLADCMTRRMSASRTLSYNDAEKACKEQLRGRKTDAALNNSPKPVS